MWHCARPSHYLLDPGLKWLNRTAPGSSPPRFWSRIGDHGIPPHVGRTVGLLVRVVEGNFEGTKPPAQLLVGDVYQQHWEAREEARAEQ